MVSFDQEQDKISQLKVGHKNPLQIVTHLGLGNVDREILIFRIWLRSRHAASFFLFWWERRL
jgi:hypothetical protein